MKIKSLSLHPSAPGFLPFLPAAGGSTKVKDAIAPFYTGVHTKKRSSCRRVAGRCFSFLYRADCQVLPVLRLDFRLRCSRVSAICFRCSRRGVSDSKGRKKWYFLFVFPSVWRMWSFRAS